MVNMIKLAVPVNVSISVKSFLRVPKNKVRRRLFEEQAVAEVRKALQAWCYGE